MALMGGEEGIYQINDHRSQQKLQGESSNLVFQAEKNCGGEAGGS
jgi:hypothetical protein